MVVGYRGIGRFVDVIVKELAGEVTHQDGRGIGFRLDLVDEEIQRMPAVLAEAGCQGTDVNQVIGMDHNEVGNVLVLLVDVYIQQVELHVFLQDILQVEQVAIVAPFGIVDDDERIVVAVGGRENQFLVPTGDGSPHVRNPAVAGTSVRSVGMRNFGKQGSRNVFTECQRHEAYDGP